MCWCELPSEFVSKVSPVEESVGAGILWLLFPAKDPGRPLCCSAGFHVGHGPHNFSLFIRELVQTKPEVCLAGVQECLSIGALPVELEGRGRPGPGPYGGINFLRENG
jgi:hypothetical protein